VNGASKGKPARAWRLFPACLLLLGACTLPPYQQDLSLGVLGVQKMTHLGVVGPLDIWPWDVQGRNLYYYPSKDALLAGGPGGGLPLKGFLAAVGAYSVRVYFIDYDGSNYLRASNSEWGIDSADPRRFTFAAQSVKDGDAGDGQELLGVIWFDPKGLGREFLLLDQGFREMTSPAPLDLSLGIAAGLSDPPLDPLVVGGSYYPAEDPSSDVLNGLCIDRTTGLYSEASAQTAAGSPPGPYSGVGSLAAVREKVGIPAIPSDLESAFYFHDPSSKRSYLSYYDNERHGYRSFYWVDPVSPETQAPVTVLTGLEGRRIDLLLSNGWLFSRGEDMGYVYDAEGELLNTFPMGGLQLSYEIFIGSEAFCIFSVPAWFLDPTVTEGSESRLYLLLYYLPTSSLDTL
jgi:hypothetical protein